MTRDRTRSLDQELRCQKAREGYTALKARAALKVLVLIVLRAHTVVRARAINPDLGLGPLLLGTGTQLRVLLL